MSKKLKNVYEKIYDLDNLRKAHKMARKDKLFYKEVKMVDGEEDKFLMKIQVLLREEKYLIKQEDYRISTIYDKIKTRELMKLDYYPHRIIQWAIMLQLHDMFMQVFEPFTCASIPKRGGKRVMQMMDRYMQDEEGTKYCLKMDIKKFYPNINHQILKDLLRKKIADKKLLKLLDMLIDSHPGEKGLPIGSYLSQYLANYYLAFFDHWLKEELKCKYVIRYMDDIVIFDSSKESLHTKFNKIKAYLKNNLDLLIKPNYQIFPTAIRGVDYVGYRFFYKYRLFRKRTCKKFKAKMLSIKAKQSRGQFINYREWASVNSYIGWIIHCDSYRLYEKYIEPILPSVLKYYYYVIAKKDKKKYKKYRKKLLGKKGRKDFK